MKLLANNSYHVTPEGAPISMIKERRELDSPIPPHERKVLMRIAFDERDWNLFRTIYGDEDEAMAAARVLMDAPPEIQILAIQLMNLIKGVASYEVQSC